MEFEPGLVADRAQVLVVVGVDAVEDGAGGCLDDREGGAQLVDGVLHEPPSLLLAALVDRDDDDAVVEVKIAVAARGVGALDPAELERAAGIEPASRDISVQVSTCVVGSFPPSPPRSPTDGVPQPLAGHGV